MGIRVGKDSLERQLKIKGCTGRKELVFHRMLLNGELPFCIGGGSVSRDYACSFLKNPIIGEVQSGIWPDTIHEQSNQLVSGYCKSFQHLIWHLT